MIKLKCEICGGTLEVQAGGHVIVCLDCGVTYSKARMKELCDQNREKKPPAKEIQAKDDTSKGTHSAGSTPPESEELVCSFYDDLTPADLGMRKDQEFPDTGTEELERYLNVKLYIPVFRKESREPWEKVKSRVSGFAEAPGSGIVDSGDVDPASYWKLAPDLDSAGSGRIQKEFVGPGSINRRTVYAEEPETER